MTEQFLHGAQVLRRLEQVGSERVPEHVGVYVFWQSLQPGPAGNAALHDPRTQAGAAHADEQGVLADRGQRRPFCDPALQRCDCLAGCPACVGPVLAASEGKQSVTPKSLALEVLGLLSTEAA